MVTLVLLVLPALALAAPTQAPAQAPTQAPVQAPNKTAQANTGYRTYSYQPGTSGAYYYGNGYRAAPTASGFHSAGYKQIGR